MIRNSCTGTTTLSGTITKDGTKLTLDVGTQGLSVTGSVKGVSAGSDLIVQGAVTLGSGDHPYNGPTTVNASSTLTVGGTLSGKVVMKTAGTSLPTAPLTVTLLYFNPGLFRVTDEAADARTTTTAPDGSFTVAGLDTSAAGVYRVRVQCRGVH